MTGHSSPLTEPVLVDQGDCFLAGRWLAPPYEVTWQDGELWVNDRRVALATSSENRPWGGEHVSRLVVRKLGSDDLVLAFPGQPLVVLPRGSARVSLYRLLLGREVARDDVLTVEEFLPPGFDRQVWHDWIAEFQPSTEFLDRAEPVLEQIDANLAASERQMLAVRRMNYLAYPLTVGGMLLTALAVGHLLLSRPAVGPELPPLPTPPHVLAAVNWSLLLVIVLSGLDLAWTLLAAQAGHMRELNPLGSQLIHSPLMLMAFKATLTTVSVGLLFLLRRQRPAQLAAWWACLICTLLTVRWLVLNSLFVA